MAYTKITDFAAKDALLTGTPTKVVKGTEIGAEFDAIETADALNVKTTALGTGVATALAINIGSAGASVVLNGALGTPSSGTVTNLTGTASININGTVGATTPAAGAFTTLSATGVTTVQAGTALLPALIPSGDTNTGVWFPAADTVAVSTGGAERMRIDASGQITGGNSAGNSALALLSTTASVNARIRLTTTSDTSSVAYVLGNSHASVNKQCAVYQINSNGGMQFQTGQTAGAEPTTGVSAFRIQDDFAGVVAPTVGLGYGTGAGGTVTQATSRVTGVTLSKPTGAITLFTAAGSATAATFTVTNTLVAATDAIVLSVNSGTNVYLTAVTAVATSSFNITFWTTGGVASDAPVINFAIIKGAPS